MERIPIYKIGDILLVSIQIDLQDQDALNLQDDLSNRIVASGARGVVIDISALELVDSFIGRMLSTIAAVSRVLDARTVVVGNVGFLQAGMPLLPDAAIDDGLLDVVLLYPKRFVSWLPLAFRVLARRPRTDETIARMRGRTVMIRVASPTPRQLDGDPLGAGRELRMTCLHGRVLVRVPR